jgi:hypothetical protein
LRDKRVACSNENRWQWLLPCKINFSHVTSFLRPLKFMNNEIFYTQIITVDLRKHFFDLPARLFS